MEHKVGVIGVGFVGTAVSYGLGMVADVREYDKYKDTESLDSVVNNSDILFLCLPTPMDSETGMCDTSIITQVVSEIEHVADEPKLMVVKSTVPPGTTQALANAFPRHAWAFNPEFLTEKNYLKDFINQDRIFLGFTEPFPFDEVKKLEDLYEQFIALQSSRAKVYFCKSGEAEMLKYMTNCFLATKVSFFNEMYETCKAPTVGVDFDRVVSMMQKDPRIGTSHMNVPGPDGDFGFGGKCFPKDMCGLISFAEDNDVDPIILHSAWAKNLLVRENYDWEEIPGATSDFLHSDIEEEK
jgi:UDPglucose 6-dehydrogenase